MTDREAMKLALEALESAADNECNFHDYKHAADALRKALEQEPWDTTDMAHRAGGLSMEQDEIVPSYYSGVTGDYMEQDEIVPSDYSGVTGDYMEQEPVAWVKDLTSAQPRCVTDLKYISVADTEAGVQYIPLYTAPPKREWQGLTDEEIQKVAYDMGTIGDLSHDEFDVCRAVIAKLKEKNSG